MDRLTHSNAVVILTFTLDGQEYGLPVTDVVQIIEMVALTHLPHLPPAVRGVFNMRGEITPVLDLRLRFGLPEVPYRLQTPIILVSFNGRLLGLAVDNVAEVLEIQPEDMLDAGSVLPPELAGSLREQASLDYLLGIAKVNRRLTPILCAARILSGDEQARLEDALSENQPVIIDETEKVA